MAGLEGNDTIEKLLETTGLSCDDLLLKLQLYKQLSAKNAKKCDNTVSNAQNNVETNQIEENDSNKKQFSQTTETNHKLNEIGERKDTDMVEVNENCDINLGDTSIVSRNEKKSENNEETHEKCCKVNIEVRQEINKIRAIEEKDTSSNESCSFRLHVLNRNENEGIHRIIQETNNRITEVKDKDNEEEITNKEFSKTETETFSREIWDICENINSQKRNFNSNISLGEKDVIGGTKKDTEKMKKKIENISSDKDKIKETVTTEEKKENIDDYNKKDFSLGFSSDEDEIMELDGKAESAKEEIKVLSKSGKDIQRNIEEEDEGAIDIFSRAEDDDFDVYVVEENEEDGTTSSEKISYENSNLNNDTSKEIEEKQNIVIKAGNESGVSSTNEESSSSFVDEVNSEDSVRNFLKMQLNSLRMKKKNDAYLSSLLKKPFEISVIKPRKKSLNHTATSSDLASLEQNVISDICEEANKSETKPESNLKLFDKLMQANKLIDVDFKEKEDSKKVEKKQTLQNCKISVKAISELNSSTNLPIETPFMQLLPKENTQEQKKMDKSPFVSDSLNDFLNEGSKLKISYTVPKLGAEEGLKETEKIDLFLQTPKIPKNDYDKNNRQREKLKTYKAKTLAEKRRLIENRKLFSVRKSEKRNSFVLYNKKKLWIPSIVGAQCLATIDSNKKNKTLTNPVIDKPKRRHSLLQYCKNFVYKSKYKPGPLCRKSALIVDQQNWQTEVKVLPKIFLEVLPEIGKEISPTVIHLLPFSTELTEERINFALSVLKTNENKSELKSYVFPVPYKNNEDKIIVRKPKIIDLTDNDLNPEEEITIIINKLIIYVETKEIECTLIKEDERIEPIKEPKIPKKRKIRRITRQDMELQRLNCKVITFEPEPMEDEPCSKLYCKYGCVCKSLSCDNILRNHCRKVECMFNCSCPLSNFDDNLSPYTLNQIEDEAKKNLAKIEREFTQTVIHQGNNTIVVGNGSRSKIRRACKIPKKYNDYDYNYLDELLVSTPITQIELKKCTVDVEKLELESVIPFCLAHKLHDCFCGAKTPIPEEFGPLNISKTLPKSPVFVRPRLVQKIKVSLKPQIEEEKEYTCARVRQVFSKYVHRNKEPIYLNKLLKNIHCSKIVNVNNKDEIDVVNETEIDDLKVVEEKTILNKRKQTFEVREESFALQRRKKVKRMSQSSVVQKYEPIFEDEIKISLSENREFSKIIGEEHMSLNFLRLLPWKSLIKCYKNGSVKIWCMMNQETVIIVNNAHKLPPFNFIDIKQSRQSTDIIKWILTNNLPADKPEELLHVILTPTKMNYYLITGICLKNIKEVEEIKTIQTTSNHNSKIPRVKSVLLPPNRTLKCSHRSMHHQIKTLIFTNNDYPSRFLLDKDLKQFIELPLPKVVETCKWRMIYLHSDFSYLIFLLSNYSIKYTDLKDVVNISNNIKRTVKLRNNEFSNDYKHPFFGIYCVSNYKDRLFIGPFLKDENHNIVTLRFMRGELVESSLFHKMQGKVNLRNSFWVYEIVDNTDDIVETINDMIDEESISSNKGKMEETAVKNIEILNLNKPLKGDLTIDLATIRKLDPLQISSSSKEVQPKSVATEKRALLEMNRSLQKINILENITLGDHFKSSLIKPLTTLKLPNKLNEKKKDEIEAPKKIFCISDDEFIEIEDDPIRKTVNENSDSKLVKAESILKETLLISPFAIELKKTGAFKEFNKYFIVNIKNLGYFGAYQEEKVNYIDVFLPNYDKFFRFPNAAFAAKTLIQILYLHFAPIGDFKITVELLDKVETVGHIRSSVFNKEHICGNFGSFHEGYYETISIPYFIRDKYNINMSSLSKILAKNQEENVERLVNLFGSLLMSHSELKNHENSDSILNWAIQKISKLQKLESEYTIEKDILVKYKDLHILKIRKLLASLPENALKEYEEILKNMNKPTEIIEIDSSDDEDNQKIEESNQLLKLLPNNRSLLKSHVSNVHSGQSSQSVLKKSVNSNEYTKVKIVDVKILSVDK